MAKIKKTDINKLSKLEQQIEELKKQKKKQEEELAKNIGDHIMNSIDIDELDSVDDLYTIIDEVVERFNQTEENINKNIDDINSENETENIDDINSENETENIDDINSENETENIDDK